MWLQIYATLLILLYRLMTTLISSTWQLIYVLGLLLYSSVKTWWKQPLWLPLSMPARIRRSCTWTTRLCWLQHLPLLRIKGKSTFRYVLSVCVRGTYSYYSTPTPTSSCLATGLICLTSGQMMQTRKWKMSSSRIKVQSAPPGRCLIWVSTSWLGRSTGQDLLLGLDSRCLRLFCECS